MASVRDSAARLDAQSLVASIKQALRDVDPDAISCGLWLAAFNQFQLPSQLFCQAMALCDDPYAALPAAKFQTAEAVPVLLEMVGNPSVSFQCQLLACCIAAKITVHEKLETAPVKKQLWKLETKTLSSINQYYIESALNYLEHPEKPNAGIDIFDVAIQDMLPESAPKNIIGKGYTVRRSVLKLGRNDPCHCGSGKKYKKCCSGKDQELLRDASAYAGVTRSEITAHPGLVNDPQVIWNMRMHEVKNLVADELGDKQLLAAYQQASQFNLWQLAFDMLLACESRLDEDDFDQGYFDDLLYQVLETNDAQLAHRIKTHCVYGDLPSENDSIQFRFDLLDNPQHYQKLEERCLKSIANQADPESGNALIDLAYSFESQFPGLSLVFARAAIVSNPESYLDNQALLEVIHGIRIDLDINPWLDPAESLFQWQQHYEDEKKIVAVDSAIIEQLTGQLKTARASLKNKQNTLQEMEQELLSKSRQPVEEPLHEQTPPPAKNDNRDANSTIERLRHKVSGLKAEISEQQTQRNQLRDALKKERIKTETLAQDSLTQNKESSEQQSGSGISDSEVSPAGRPLIPAYNDTFIKACSTLDSKLTGRAMIAVGRFAGHDPEIWRQTKTIKRLNDHYRIRINRDYRLLLQWKAGKQLHILDLIPRQELEGWIKRHG